MPFPGFKSFHRPVPSNLKKGVSPGSKRRSHIAFQDLLSLDLEEQEIKLAHATSTLPTGNLEIVQLLSFNVQGLSQDDVVTKLKTALTEMNLKNPRLVGVVPCHWVVTRNIEVPSRDPDEIREIVGFQATRHTPYARNEIIVDYINLGVFKSVYTKILLIIVPQAATVRFYELALQLGLKVEKIVFAPEALARNLSRQVKLENEKLPVCLVRVDTSGSEFMVISNGKLLFVRSFPVGAQHFAAAKESYLIRFVEELKKSLETYQGENIEQNPSLFFLTGATQGLADLDEMIETGLKFSVKHLSDVEGMPIRQDVKDKSSNQNVSFLHVTASAILLNDLTIDLAPEENKIRKSVEERSKEIIKTGILSMVVLGLLCAFFLSHLYFKTTRIDQLKSRYNPIKKEAAALEMAYAHVRAIKAQLESRGKSLETLVELSLLMPADIYLTEVRFEGEGKFSMKGTSAAKASIFSLADQVERSKLFRNVQTKYITGRTEEGKELADFEIISALE